MRHLPIAAAVTALAGACSAPRFAVEPRVGQSEVSGHLASSAPGDPLQKNDVEGALNLDQDDSAPGLRADLEFGSPHVVVAWSRTQNDGEGQLTGQMSDDGVILPVGTDVATDVDLDVYTAIVTFDLLPTETFELGIGLGVHVIDLDATVVSLDGLNPGTIDLQTTVPIPVLALQAGFEVGRFEVAGLFSGMQYASDGDEATFYDLDVGARFRILGEGVTGSITAGWRMTRLDARYEDEDDNADVDLELSGPYVGLSIGF